MAKKSAHIEVVWTNIAENQLKGIVDYWIDNNQSSSYSEQLIEAIWERIEVLCVFPESAKSTGFKDIRNAILGHYSILYRKYKNQLVILAIWDNRDDPEKFKRLLLKLK